MNGVCRVCLLGRCGGRRNAFTLVELLVACMIVSIALLGIYGVFKGFVEAEGDLTQEWMEHRVAKAVLDELAEAVASSIEIGDVTAMSTGRADGRRTFCCTTAVLSPLASTGCAVWERRRYAWDGEGDLYIQRIAYSGSEAVPSMNLAEDDPWANVLSSKIGSGIRSISFQFKVPSDDKWQGKYEDSEESPVLVRVEVAVGRTRLSRTVVRYVSGPIAGEG